jgi:hypothetical protein
MYSRQRAGIWEYPTLCAYTRTPFQQCIYCMHWIYAKKNSWLDDNQVKVGREQKISNLNLSTFLKFYQRWGI